MKNLQDRLREVREINKMSQISLAKELQVQPATISRYECGTSDPDTKTVRWYAERFDVSLDWLFGLTDDPTPRAVTPKQRAELQQLPSTATLTDEELAARLPEDMRESLLALIRIEREKSD